jgi:hypothetical protein
MVSLRSALLLADRWRGAGQPVEKPAGYVPQTQAGTPVRAAVANRSDKPVRMPDLKRDRA